MARGCSSHNQPCFPGILEEKYVDTKSVHIWDSVKFGRLGEVRSDPAEYMSKETIDSQNCLRKS